EGRPVECTLDSNQKMFVLNVITGLSANDEFGEPAVKVVTRNVEAAVCPRAAEVRADVEPRPIIGRRQRRRWRLQWHVGGVRGEDHAERRKSDARQAKIVHDGTLIIQ